VLDLLALLALPAHYLLYLRALLACFTSALLAFCGLLCESAARSFTYVLYSCTYVLYSFTCVLYSFTYVLYSFTCMLYSFTCVLYSFTYVLYLLCESVARAGSGAHVPKAASKLEPLCIEV
jgi:hypothetical protein